ncbi:hypothetical protein ZYGR_0AD02080 [Zygosaccharomyces rouxii]|uniref:ZYRO0G10802p n=2 Tax=Zygosaccharomyces rouxii TaxID=4956 RepID=C5E092_ZYGRC|nr:uncharacterized protein ZYRO0G10802g [Zygosaccharomyces rouxii]KAH9202521.1 hypothetical protein LQ764DRAFT_26652 [Zygosaccharomyces rouxii]GAV51025.1 hypothetical protein ZYGR_0AD02080 [Zygosaccharomyces rouxii]CAR29526.1 ZYRO0G10802p [Zygosaccharomyces rouxii]
MSSEQLLVRHVRDNLITHKHTLEEFAQLVAQHHRSKHESEPDEATIKDWYTKYEQQDDAALQLSEQRIENFLNDARQAQLLELEKSQLAESFSLEDVVNKLYHVDQLLDKRLAYMNESMKDNVTELQKFNELLELANSTKTDDDEDISS